jgi:hypothetical protein
LIIFKLTVKVVGVLSLRLQVYIPDKYQFRLAICNQFIYAEEICVIHQVCTAVARVVG